MDRLRDLGANVLLSLGLVIGGGLGLYLGAVTERGAFGIITVVAGIAGAGAGIYVAQAILTGGHEEP